MISKMTSFAEWVMICGWLNSRDLCINMNNHQNAIFRQLDNFIKHSHSFAMTIFHKITHSLLTASGRWSISTRLGMPVWLCA
jgi:uncharacterized protein YllA (UPF0747 family)